MHRSALIIQHLSLRNAGERRTSSRKNSVLVSRSIDLRTDDPHNSMSGNYPPTLFGAFLMAAAQLVASVGASNSRTKNAQASLRRR
jgi:hypothetical protein